MKTGIGENDIGVTPLFSKFLTVSALLGAVKLARAVSYQTLSDEILELTREVLKQLVRRNAQAKDGGGDSGKKT